MAKLMNIEQIMLNKNNLENLKFVLKICQIFKIKNKTFFEILNKFKGLQYRQQTILKKNNLIIINADKIHLTGKKQTKKIYYKHTGHPGGLKDTTPEKMKLNNKSTDIIKKAIIK